MTSRMLPTATGLACALFLGVSIAPAQTTGSVVHNGVDMPVQSAVAVWNAKELELRVYLLPFEATAQHVAVLQQAETYWMLDDDEAAFRGVKEKPNVDRKKWPTWAPHACFTFDWAEPQVVGDVQKADGSLYMLGVARKNSNVGMHLGQVFGHPFKGSLTGTIKEGEQVALVSKDKGQDGKDELSWDFTAVAKMIARRPE